MTGSSATVVDSSALVAVVLGEPDAESLLAVMTTRTCVISAVSFAEAAIVVEARQGPDAARDLQLLVDAIADDVVPVDRTLAVGAVTAWRRFGKGRHPAALNFGDCFPYALAASLGAELLFKGTDFSQTDISAACG